MITMFKKKKFYKVVFVDFRFKQEHSIIAYASSPEKAVKKATRCFDVISDIISVREVAI